jgi:quercetin dioxygenase-like cupin family protein
MKAQIATVGIILAAGLLPSFVESQQVPSTGATEHFVPHGTGAKFSEKVEEAEVKLTSSQTDGRFTLQDEVWHPGFDVKPHFHKEHAETFYVMSGQIEWTVNGKTQLMTAGDVVFIPPKAIHSVHVVGTTDAHILFISQPGGFEHLEEKRKQYTDEQREDPKIKAQLREFGDAYFPDAK